MTNMEIKKETLANSELTYHIITKLQKSNKTPTELSKGLETSSQSVNNYLKQLKELGVVERAEKQGRKQPYELNIENLKEFLLELFEIYIDSLIDVNSYEDVIESELEMYSVFTPYSIEDALDRDSEILLYSFMDVYMSFNKESTINDMFKAFLDGLEMSELERFDIGWLYGLKAISKKRHGYTKDPEALFINAVRHYKDFPDTIEKVNSFRISPENKNILIDVETESKRTCPKCGEELPENLHLEVGEDNKCPECGQKFENPNNVSVYICPECGSEIENPEHREETECGCGTLINVAENEKEVREIEDKREN